MKRNSQSYVEEFYRKEGYELLSEYKNNRTPLKMKCPVGHITDTMTFWSFKKGCRCPKCSNRAKLDYNFVKEQFEKEGYSLISKEYVNANSKLKTLCPKGHDWDVTYGHFYDGKRCGECDTSKKLDYCFVKQEFEKEGYELLSKTYKSAHTHLKVKCPKGHITSTMTWNNFKRGQGCRICNESKGEREVSKILDMYNIEYIREYRFPDCKDKYRLPFDFYLPKYNLCIEYDGEQHFKPLEYLGGLSELEGVKKRDAIKNAFCNDKNILLIRIPYWQFDNIEDILKENLKLL